MKEEIAYLGQTNLFFGMEPQDIAGLLCCLGAKRTPYAEGDTMIEEGSSVYEIGILLSGHGRAVKWEPSGRLIIITLLQKGSETGAILAASAGRKSPVTVQAQDAVSLLRIPFDRIITRCEKACPRHDQLLRNYINIVAEKGLVLHERIDCLLRPTIRDKIMTYLLRVSREQQKRTFTIPMNRNAMAEYLNVDRSALSRALSHLKREGIIDYHKNTFRLL